MSQNLAPGNPYIDSLERGDVHPEAAPGYATLALAYEQRTATLVALMAQENLADVNYDNLLLQITTRLGLK